jgi:GT2 family glycosyltransferase
MALTSIITVNFHQPEVTLDLLNSIDLYYSKANIEIILVDNGSAKDNEGYFRKHHPNLIYLRSEKNLGFAGGNNLGILKSSGEFIFLLNNDIEITNGVIEELVDTLQENSHVGIISPKINYFDDKKMIQYAGFTAMNYFTCRNECIGQYEHDDQQHDHQVKATGYVHGAAMMIRREVLKNAGLMSENFFLYYEEMDWCDQIRKAGYQVWINTNALIYHKESISVGKNSLLKEYFMNRNRILFMRRNAGPGQRLVFYLYFAMVVTPRNILKYIFSGNTKFISVLFKAINWNLTNKVTSSTLGYPIGK